MTLEKFFRAVPKAALAFSGGTDSALLMAEATRLGADVKAYFVRTPFQPEFEVRDAKRLSEETGGKMEILPLNILTVPNVRENGPRRCYYCKRAIFETIGRAALRDGYSVLIDGTNASDEEAGRPGMQALRELFVRSPLRECGITKKEVRERSRALGLFTWDKPSYSCLATRLPSGQEITEEALCKIEKTETALMSLGFSDFRVRTDGKNARLVLTEKQLPEALRLRREVLSAMKEYDTVSLDLRPREESV